jgi:ribosomal protein S17
MNVDTINKHLSEGIKSASLLPRGMFIQGKVVSAKRRKTVTVEREMVRYLSKYSRWAKFRSRISAHVPSDIEIKEGDMVEIGQTRKISKTKSWVVTKIIGRESQ